MDTLLGLAKAIPPDIWLVMSVSASAVVIGLHWVVTHLIGRDAAHDEPDVDTGTRADSDRELLGS